MSRYRRELGDRLLAMRLAAAGRVHQYPEVQALRRFLTTFAVDCLFDVGANRGQYAIMARLDANIMENERTKSLARERERLFF